MKLSMETIISFTITTSGIISASEDMMTVVTNLSNRFLGISRPSWR